MSDTVNFYESPQAPVEPERTLGTQPVLTDTMLRYLKEASPWMRFIGILGFIGCGSMALSGIGIVAGMSALASQLEDIFAEMGNIGNIFGAFFGASLGIIYIVAAVICFFPAYFAYISGAKIRAYTQSGADQELELAFKKNKSLWKFYGILSIISLAFIPVLIVIVSVIAVSSVLNG